MEPDGALSVAVLVITDCKPAAGDPLDLLSPGKFHSAAHIQGTPGLLGFLFCRDKALLHLCIGPTGHAAVGIQVEVGPSRLQLGIDLFNALAGLFPLADDFLKHLFHLRAPFRPQSFICLLI